MLRVTFTGFDLDFDKEWVYNETNPNEKEKSL